MNHPLPPVAPPIATELADFAELWRTVGRYRWNIVGMMAVLALLGLLHAFSATPIFRATVTVLIENRPDHAVQVQEVYDPGYGAREYLGTQFELLRSRELAGRVVDKLDLAHNTDLLPPPGSLGFVDALRAGQWHRLLPFLPEEEVEAELPEALRERAISALLKDITIEPMVGTLLMKVHVESPSRQTATTIANTLGELYVESGLQSRLEATERATRWLTARLADLRGKLESSEQALQQYREKHELVNVGGARGMVEEELVDNARKLRDAQRKKTELASSYRKIQEARGDERQLQEISSLLLDPLVQRSADNLSQASQAVKHLEERYGEKHPQMASAQARLEAAQRQYNEQLRLAANGIRAEYEIAVETERALLGLVTTTRGQIRRLDQRGFELKGLEREVETNRELYEMFLKRFKETDTTSSYEQLNARIVDRAVPPTGPFKPAKKKILLLWTLAGLFLGLLLAALRHLIAQTVQTPEQLEQLTQMPVISVLPPVAGMGKKTSAPQLVVDHPRVPFAEGVRTIRASLHLSDVDKRMKKLMFTSALPQEGKSSVASAFAAVLGHTERIILVEADLRAPSLKKIFGISAAQTGIVELLTGQAKLEQAVWQHKASGIDVLAVAQIPANPAEVIASAAFGKLLDILAQRYDRVIVDTPPTQVASDSLLIAHRMDAVLFVVHGATTGMRTIQTAIKHLRSAQAPLLGHVLNQVDARRAFGYEGGYYVYGQYGQQP
jgi:succinoglycan biosynthesis transport protein ExoP